MIFISTYSNGNVGLAQELQRYLIRKKQNFFLLLHPIDLTQTKRSVLEEYRDGVLFKSKQSIASPNIAAINYFRCLLTTFSALMLRGRKTHLFIAVSNVDAMAGIVCRIFYPLKVVYVSTDFSPKRRFQNGVLNSIYSVADRWAYRWADAVWHMYPEREELKKYKHRTRSFDVLDGNNFRRIARLPLEEINRFRLIYIGQINRDCRLDEAIQAVAQLKKEFPQTGLDIISTGDPEYERRLKKMAADLGVADDVVFHGQIRSPEVYEGILLRCGVGLCLYEIDKDDFAWYGTPLKVYMYAACGLLSICSDTMGPFTREYIEQDGIGFLSARGTLQTILHSIFSDANAYARMREKTIAWAATYDYDDKFDKFLALV